MIFCIGDDRECGHTVMHFAPSNHYGSRMLFIIFVRDNPLAKGQFPIRQELQGGGAVSQDRTPLLKFDIHVSMKVEVFLHLMLALADHILGREPDAAVQGHNTPLNEVGRAVLQGSVEAHLGKVGAIIVAVVFFCVSS